MKQLKLLVLASLMLGGILMSAQNANAQVGYAISYVEHIGSQVHGYSATAFTDYNSSVWYHPKVDAVLYNQNGVAVAYNTGFGDPAAEVETWKSNPAPGEQYTLYSQHFAITRYVYNDAGSYMDQYALSNYGGEPQLSPFPFLGGGPTVIVYEEEIRVCTITVTIDIPFAPPPQLTSIDVDHGIPGYSVQTILRGSNLAGTNRSINVTGGAGVNATLQPVTNQANMVDVNIQISSTAPLSDRQISLTVDGQTSNALTFHVGDRTPIIDSISPSEASTGEDVTVTITGRNFAVNPRVEISGFGISKQILSSSDTRIQAVFSVTDSALEGIRTVTIVSLGASGNGFMQGTPADSNTSNGVGFEVKPLRVTFQQFQVVGKGDSRNVNVTVSQPNNTKPITLTIVKTGNGDANFANNTKTMQITRTGNVEIKGITESGTKDDLSIKASTSNLPSEPFSVALIKITRTKLNQDGTTTETNVTDATTITIVGERIKLTAETVPTGISPSNSLWTLPGMTMEDFKVTPNPNDPTQSSSQVLPVVGLNSTAVNYVWYDGGDNREVTYKANDGNYPISAKTTFNVKRPQYQLSVVSPYTTAVDTATTSGDLELHIGKNIVTQPGIRFGLFQNQIPSPFSGDIQWVQTISRTISGRLVRGTTTDVDFRSGLDACYPYESVNSPNAFDAPGIRLDDPNIPLSYAKFDGQFSMWVMFKPSGSDSSWVPLRKINWHWLGEAQMQKSSGIWSLINHLDPSQPSMPTDSDTTDFPIWTTVVSSITGNACP